MSAPDPQTAKLMDALIREVDLLLPAEDIMLAVEEFSLGTPLASRSLDVCFGYSIVEPQESANVFSDIVVGTGLARRNDVLQPITSAETAFELADSSVLGTENLENCYAFGIIYLVSSGDGIMPTLEMALSTAGGTDPYYVFRDYDIETAIDIVNYGSVQFPSPPSGLILELYRFVVDITVYDVVDRYKNDYEVKITDMRKPRGFAGFAEEDFAASVIPLLIIGKKQTRDEIAKIKADLKLVIQAWSMGATWNPNFTDYWLAHSDQMPPRLKEYLGDELGINL